MSDQPGVRRVVVPDLDDELYELTAPLDEALRYLAYDAGEGAGIVSVPPILAGPGVEALGEIRHAIHRASGIGLIGSDGRYQHDPVRIVEFDAAYFAQLGRLLAVMRRVVYETGYYGDVDDYLNRQLAATDPAGLLDSGQALELLARFHGVLDLDNTVELAVLDGPLERARTGLEPVELTDEEEAAYRRLRDRWLTMWPRSGVSR